MVFLTAANVDKSYVVGTTKLPVLRDLSLTVGKGEMVAIVGASGVGKSTLLHVLGGLDAIDAGSVAIGEANIVSMRADDLTAFRNRHVGFVFQFHHLLPEFTALENVMMPLLIARESEAAAKAKATALLAELGLADRLHHRPGALSGGEQQRVAVARALVRAPRALLADEPSGNLDRETGARLHDLLRRLNRQKQVTVVAVTHNEGLAEACDRRLRLEAGALVPA